MRACLNRHIDIARMLAGEFNANIDISNTVREIVRSCLCDDDVRTCRVGVVVNAVVVADIVVGFLIYVTTLSITPLHLVVMDAICYVNVLMVVVVVVV